MHDTEMFNVLFLCTGNSSRSIIAEALLNQIAGSRFRAYSAGSHPAGAVHPMAIEAIDHLRFSSHGLRSKSWDEFAATDAPHMHFVITVCDRAAGEACPSWPGHPITAHWSFEDPASFVGSEQEQRALFSKVCREIKNRLDIFAMLPLEKLSRMAIGEALSAIAQSGAGLDKPAR